VERDVLPRGELVGGAYRVDGPLGRGGMGAVLRATDLRAGRQVALKVLLDGGASRAARFAREAELVARLDAVPGVVRVHARGEHRGLPWFAMELVEGEDLAQRLTRGRLPVREALELVERLARTLAECHALGVIHRDLKPANILLGPAGPRVADFGLARIGPGEGGTPGLDLDGGARFTRTGEVVGTPAFMAPEQLDSKAEVDGRADVYALGAILYQALTGEPVVDAATLPDLAAQLLAGAEPPSRLVPDLPLDVDAVVLTALATNPAARYPSAAALADDLARLRGGSRVSAVDPVARARRRLAGRLAGAALAALALGLLVGGGASLRGARRTRDRGADAAALEAHRAWEAAALGSWSLGLAPGAPLAADDVARRADELRALAARAQARDGAADAVARAAGAAAARLDDLGRLLGGRAAAPSREPFGRVVDALLARARGDLTAAAALADQALGKEPLAAALRARLWRDALAGGDPAEWRALGAWLTGLARRGASEELGAAERAVRTAALEALGPAVAGRLRAAPDAPDAARELEELVGAARTVLALDAAGLVAAVASAKVEALEASAPVWVARAGGAVGLDALPVVRRLCAVAALEPRVLAGPALRAAQEELLRPTLAAWVAATGDRRRELGRAAAVLDARLIHDVDARRPSPPALREIGLELMLEGPPSVQRAEDLLLGARCSETVDVIGPAKRLGLEGCRAIQAAWPRSRAARILRLLLAFQYEPARAATDPRLADLEATLAGDALGPGGLDLSRLIEAESLLVLARQRCAVWESTGDPAQRDGALASAAAARACTPDPYLWRSAFELELPLICARSGPEAWQALEAARAHLAAALAQAVAERADSHAEAVCLARVLNLAAIFMPPASDPGGRPADADRARLLSWARSSYAHVRARPDSGDEEAAVVEWFLVGALRHTGTPEALAEAEAVARATPLRLRTVEWAVEWVLLALARGDPAEALARLTEAKRDVPGDDARRPLSALEAFLQGR
jgi:hypothetical protein